MAQEKLRMDFVTYTEKAQAIFDHFPNEQVWFQGGLQPNRQLQSPEAGYCIVLRYDEKTTILISRFMTGISAVLPTILEYDQESLHTTIGTFGKKDAAGFVPNLEICQQLTKSVETGLASRSPNLRMDFGKWLYNDEAILISCFPNEDLWQVFQNIRAACQDGGYPLEMARIAHITTARFTGSVPQSEFEQFAHLMKSSPTLTSTNPSAIDLAMWRCDGLKFEIAVYKQFPL